jgi:predicted molibdopterin-dependent oxidoreductase YjgC
MALHFAESRVNLLTNDVGDSLIGIPEYKVCEIRIEPVRSALQPAAR